MFKFLKDKLKSVVSNFSKKVEEEAEQVPDKEPHKREPSIPPKAEFPPKKDPEKKPEPKKEEKQPELKKEPDRKPEPKKEEKKPEPKKEPEKTIKKEEPKTHESSGQNDPPKKLERPKTEPEKKPEHTKHREPPDNEHPPHKLPVATTAVPAEIVVKEAPKSAKSQEPIKKKTGILGRIFGKKEEPKKGPAQPLPKKEESIQGPAAQEPAKEAPAPIQELSTEAQHEEPKHEKKGFFDAIAQKFTHVELSGKKFDELFWDLEVTMLENNVAVEVIDKIKVDLHKRIVGIPLRKSDVDKAIISSLRQSIEELFEVPAVHIVDKIGTKKPLVILFLGINGAGKTTTIAKVAHMLKGLGYGVVMAAGDTFRAAAIQQLESHANAIGVKLIKHDYGSDAAAVAFDAVAYAKAKNLDVVLIDTAGRLHSNVNLMDELKKIVRVANPDLKIFIGESITGNDCVEQAKQFNDAVGIDGIILSKADVDEKGGAAISVSYVTKRPIMYLGMGQNYSDLQEFKSEVVISGLGLS